MAWCRKRTPTGNLFHNNANQNGQSLPAVPKLSPLGQMVDEFAWTPPWRLIRVAPPRFAPSSLALTLSPSTKQSASRNDRKSLMEISLGFCLGRSGGNVPLIADGSLSFRHSRWCGARRRGCHAGPFSVTVLTRLMRILRRISCERHWMQSRVGHILATLIYRGQKHLSSRSRN